MARHSFVCLVCMFDSYMNCLSFLFHCPSVTSFLCYPIALYLISCGFIVRNYAYGNQRHLRYDVDSVCDELRNSLRKEGSKGRVALVFRDIKREMVVLHG